MYTLYGVPTYLVLNLFYTIFFMNRITAVQHSRLTKYTDNFADFHNSTFVHLSRECERFPEDSDPVHPPLAGGTLLHASQANDVRGHKQEQQQEGEEDNRSLSGLREARGDRRRFTGARR